MLIWFEDQCWYAVPFFYPRRIFEMVMFVDETECPEYFIVAGLLVNSFEDVSLAFKRFKNRISETHMSKQNRMHVFTEFKSTLIDRNYQKIKYRMLEEINSIEHCVIYGCHKKYEDHFSQKDKERIYINMISKIASSVDTDVTIVFDSFNKDDFENNILKKLKSIRNVSSAKAADSQKEDGLKLIDNVCSVIRLHKTDLDVNGYYQYISNHILEV